MPVIMIFYYIISIFLAGLILWNFFREKEDIESALLYLIVLLPLILRIFQIR